MSLEICEEWKQRNNYQQFNFTYPWQEKQFRSQPSRVKVNTLNDMQNLIGQKLLKNYEENAIFKYAEQNVHLVWMIFSIVSQPTNQSSQNSVRKNYCWTNIGSRFYLSYSNTEQELVLYMSANILLKIDPFVFQIPSVIYTSNKTLTRS